MTTNIIANKYKLLEQLGIGMFGGVYKAINIRTKQTVAIKIEALKVNTKLLKNETKIYQYLNSINVEGIPTVLWFGVDDKNYYMAITMLGQSIQNIKDRLRENLKTFSLNDIVSITIKMVQRLESIHSKGFIHRDVKPDNFLFGLDNKKDVLYLIDFGFCKRYLLEDGVTHIPIRCERKILGTLNYISINIHDGYEPTRRDDLESIAYIMIYLINEKLAWDNIANNTNNINIRSTKLIIMNDEKTPLVIRNYFSYCRSLKFDETPNYEQIYNILNIF